MNKKIKRVAFCAMIAATYAVLTIILAPISYGGIQFRFSEALTILPFYSPYAIWGLTVGCLISNVFSPVGLLDILIGTSATFIASYMTHLCSKSKIKWMKWLAPVPPIVVNAVMIGLLLMYESGVCTFTSFIVNSSGIALGQAVCCGLGYPLMLIIDKTPAFNKFLYK